MQYCAKIFAERYESNLLVVAIQLWWSWSHEDSITRHDDVAEYLIVYIHSKYQQYRGHSQAWSLELNWKWIEEHKLLFDILGHNVIKLLTNIDSFIDQSHESCILSVIAGKGKQLSWVSLLWTHDQPKYRVKATSAQWIGKINLIWVYISSWSSMRQGH